MVTDSWAAELPSTKAPQDIETCEKARQNGHSRSTALSRQAGGR